MVEQRKIMSLGRSSLVISLPKHWVKLNELNKGDVVSMTTQKDRSLVVFSRSEKKEASRKITLTVDSDERDVLIVRRIIASYLNGYSAIKLISKNIFSVSQQKAIRHIVRVLYMRIMESDTKNMYIQTLIDETKASVMSGLRRMHLICSSMVRDALKSLENGDVKLARAVLALDDDVDHFSFFLLRLLRGSLLDPALAKRLGIEPIDCLDYQTLVHRIEHVADQATNISKCVIMLSGRAQRISTPILELILAIGHAAFDSFNKAIEAVFSKDDSNSDEIISEQKRIEKLDLDIASKSFLTEKNALTICATCTVRDSAKRMAEYATDIAEITINRAFKSAP